MATHSRTLAWEIPWMEETGRLQSMGSRRVGQNWATSLSLFTFMHWRRKWQPTPVFLPGESQGQEPGGLLSMGSHRVRHDWCDLAAAAASWHYINQTESKEDVWTILIRDFRMTQQANYTCNAYTFRKTGCSERPKLCVGAMKKNDEVGHSWLKVRFGAFFL